MAFLAQQRHVVRLLGDTVSILSVLSHLQSPSLLILIFRSITRFRFELDEPASEWSLPFAFALVLLVNTVSFLGHLVSEPTRSGAMLDFIRLSFTPSAPRLCFLDASIATIHLVQLYIAYVTNLSRNYHGASASLNATTPSTPGFLLEMPNSRQQDALIMDIRWRSVWRCLRSPVPSISNDQSPPVTEPMNCLALLNDRFRLFPRTPIPAPTPPIRSQQSQPRGVIGPGLSGRRTPGGLVAVE